MSDEESASTSSSDLPELQEVDDLVDDVVRKKHVAHEKRLGGSVSETVTTTTTSLPGAYPSQQPRPEKPSQQQLLHLGRLRAEQKMRHNDECAVQINDAPRLQELQDRMTDLVIEEETQHSVKQRRKPKIILWGIGSTIIVIVVIVGAAVGVVVSSSSRNKELGNDRMQECWNRQSLDNTSDRYREIRQELIQYEPHLDLDTPMSSARAALCWLADFDDLHIITSPTDDLVQRFALATIYYHFVGIDSTVKSELQRSSWLRPINVCFWDYIECNEESVVTLLLGSLRLAGTIPTELALLTTLTHLELAQNSLTGTIPTNLFRLTLLEELNIGINQLSGTIPDAVGNLEALTDFRIQSNSLMGTIPDLSRLVGLKHFVIEANSLLLGLFPDISKATAIGHISITNTHISGSIPFYLYDFTSLTWLGLPANSLTGSLSTRIGRLTNLQTLDVSTGMLTGTIPTEIGNLLSLTSINLSVNPSLFGTVPSELGRLTNLVRLSVAFANKLTGTIPEEICVLRSDYSLVHLSASCGTSLRCSCCTTCNDV